MDGGRFSGGCRARHRREAFALDPPRTRRQDRDDPPRAALGAAPGGLGDRRAPRLSGPADFCPGSGRPRAGPDEAVAVLGLPGLPKAGHRTQHVAVVGEVVAQEGRAISGRAHGRRVSGGRQPRDGVTQLARGREARRRGPPGRCAAQTLPAGRLVSYGRDRTVGPQNDLCRHGRGDLLSRLSLDLADKQLKVVYDRIEIPLAKAAWAAEILPSRLVCRPEVMPPEATEYCTSFARLVSWFPAEPGVTVTFCSAVDTFPDASVACQVTVASPRAKRAGALFTTRGPGSQLSLTVGWPRLAAVPRGSPS